MTDPPPTIVNRTLPQRLPNSSYRPREYLTEKEVDRLIETARKRGRNGARDAAAILLAYRHGLRAAELCSLRWSQIDLTHGRLHVNRAKGGQESIHPLHGPELRALRPLQGQSPYVFVTEAGTPLTALAVETLTLFPLAHRRFRVGQRLAHVWFRAELAALRREVESEVETMRAELNELRAEHQRTRPPLSVVK